MDWKLALRILLAVVMLYVFYSLGVPLPAIAVLGIILVLFALMRGPAYNHIDAELTKRLPFVSGLSPWQRRLLVAMFFVLVYVLVKQAVYELLKAFGMDVQQMMLDSVESMKK